MASELRVDKIVPTDGVPTGGGGGIIQITVGKTNNRVEMSSSTFAETNLLSLNLPKGLKKYDTIIGINGEMTNDGLQFSDEIGKYNIGDNVTLTLVRKRIYLKVDVPLKVFPVDANAMYSQIRTPSPLPSPIQPKKNP